MHFSTIFAATALAGAAMAENHVVAVSNKTGSLVFTPDSFKAAQGDLVTFKFWPKNHSVAQAAFASPCAPSKDGFWSGFVPTSNADAVANTTYVLEVKNASAPIWFYCTQGKHCQSGMVGVINPPTSGDKTLAAFKSAAENATSNLSPSSIAGFGGNLTQTSPSSSSGSPSSSASAPPTSATGAASHLTGSVTLGSLAGLVAFFML